MNPGSQQHLAIGQKRKASKEDWAVVHIKIEGELVICTEIELVECGVSETKKWVL